ncbi:endo-1,4-beta-xylanase [Bradyrhizobium prioriisuperbiae]|uniref:endo-1,4-beta-xylanase n=1 Tax=Bradyrhizobium prioriisuperbiae TaxID=2854389 RepID=UPI0028EC7D7D|nr:endo-1,4-beta-xylanase [Bradyrhizobium prioritasuperba]
MTDSFLTRRAALGLLAGTAAEAMWQGSGVAAPAAGPTSEVPYGAAISSYALQDDPAYRAAVATYCQVIVPESEMKWDDLHRNRGEYHFENADRIADFARQHHLALRGHTLAWYGAMPEWVNTISTAAEAERELTGHIHTVVSRYRGLVSSWDVVNEPIPDKPVGVTDLRPFVWSRFLEEDYIPIAFRAAAAADPKAMLVLNEYDIEYVGARFRARRDALRHIVRRLLDRNVPLHAVGLQAHLYADRAIDRDGLQAFVSELKGWGLKILITELDVIDDTLPGPEQARDAAVAAKADDFLEAVFAACRPETIITWGLSDRYTWVPTYNKRADGRLNRPLPLDDAMKPKPLMAVIDRYRRRAA